MARYQSTSLIKNQLARVVAVATLPLWVACTDQQNDSAENALDASAVKTDTLVVYSSRNEHLIQPVFERYTEQTGIKIEYATDKAGILIERIKAEGEHTKADVLITVDAGMLGFAAAEGIFQALQSDSVKAAVPEYLRDRNGFWTGLSRRARTIVYSAERVSIDELSTYAALGDEKWRGRLCLRTSKKVYNQSLVAMLISQYGEAEAESIVAGWVANLAIEPTSNDTKVMQAITSGQCDIGVVNSYYFGRLQLEQPELPLTLYWPNQQLENSGVHVNVAGAGILRHSKNAAAARAFIEWLVSDDAQEIFAGVNQEYPVNRNTAVDAQVQSWGEFKASQLPLDDAYRLQPAAVKLMDRVGYK